MTLLPRFLNLEILRPALCGIFSKNFSFYLISPGSYQSNQRCTRGYFCNYLHTFITPTFYNQGESGHSQERKKREHHTSYSKNYSKRMNSQANTHSEERNLSRSDKRCHERSNDQSRRSERKHYVSPDKQNRKTKRRC